ncbi:hypothetical protein HFC66_11715 [Escherichia coli]|nr:hypothetical protein [Escherichia coli]QIV71902.1 hypothetical protein HFC67_20855 [Escherichia coli]QIV74968.1 hypothetical protein HFC66_11715 [Escherichia coli]WNT58592.1 hypothetical protein PWR53_17515 [Escherichia coli]
MRAEIALMSGSAFAVTHHAFSSGAGRTSDGNGSHASTLKSPSYTKSVSWQHYRILRRNGLMCCAYQACEINRKLLLVRYSVVSVKRVVTYLSLFPAFHHLPSDRATLSASSPVFHPSQL